MTKPRRHIAGQVALLTRRCAGKQYLLRPDKYINHVLSFETAKAANNNCIAIYGAMAMSNHIHYVVGDLLAKRSLFMQSAMSGTAKARNHNLKRDGHFWGSGSYGDTVLLDRDAMERKLIYTWLNPVAAGLVKRVKDWPGFKVLPEDWGKKIEIERPESFYGRKSPSKVVLRPLSPPGYEDMTLEEVKAYFEEKIKQGEKEIARQRRRQNLNFSGITKVKSMEPTYSPEREWPLPKKINPRFATRDIALMNQAVSNYKAFCKDYEDLRQKWLKGTLKRAKFPCGTLALRYKAPIKCLAPPEDEPGLMACQT